MSFVRGIQPIWTFVDLLGEQLDDTYYISYLTNVFPYVPQLVYQTNQGPLGAAWRDPIQFLANGTLPDNIYFNPNQVFRLEIRQGPLSTDPLIYEVNNYVPDSVNVSPPPVTGSSNQDNQIVNPQFAFVNFPVTTGTSTPSLVIASAGTYNIAPGWQLILAGTGSCALTQLVYDGAQNTPGTNIPPYALRINASGSWTSVILQQTFNGLGAIWQNQYVAASLLARSEDSNAYTIVVKYVPNSPGNPITIQTAAVSVGSPYGLIQGVQPVTPPSNTALNNVAYVRMQIVLPNVCDLDISDVQVTGQTSAVVPPFVPNLDLTLESQLNQQFNVYYNSIIMQPKDTILSGWSFPQNPWQFNGAAVGRSLTTQTAQCAYIADQTILYQAAASQVNYGQSLGTGGTPSTNDFGNLVVGYVGNTDNRFALIQYVDPYTIAPYWNQILSSLVRARIHTTSSAIRLKVRLIYRTTLPSTIGNTEPIASWPNPAGGADPVFSAGWTAITPAIDQAPVLSNAYLANGSLPTLPYNGFQMPTGTTTTMTMAIVVYTMDQMVVGDSVEFSSVSLIPNQFAIDANPKTNDQVLRECQYYYETSYPYGTAIGTGSTSPSTPSSPGAITSLVPLYTSAGAIYLYINPFTLNFYQDKRSINPTITFYSPSAGSTSAQTKNKFDVGILNGAGYANLSPTTNPAALPVADITQSSTSYQSATYIAGNNSAYFGGTSAVASYVAALTFHYECDSRLGS